MARKVLRDQFPKEVFTPQSDDPESLKIGRVAVVAVRVAVVAIQRRGKKRYFPRRKSRQTAGGGPVNRLILRLEQVSWIVSFFRT